MAFNTLIMQDLRDKAVDLGVALALPEYTNRVDSQSQNHILYMAASELELIQIEHEAQNDE